MTFRKRPEERDTLGSMSKPIEASIVVVDDEPSIRELLVASLHFAGFEVNTAASGSEAIEVIEKVQPDLIVLDVMLPDIDGFTVTRRIRQEGINAPVLFLTARDDTQDKIMGLTVGGDDYVTKPFSLEEVVARIRAILRRTREQVEDDPIIRVADLEINEDSHDVTRAGQPVDLSPTEYKLLRYLMDNEGRRSHRRIVHLLPAQESRRHRGRRRRRRQAQGDSADRNQARHRIHDSRTEELIASIHNVSQSHEYPR